MKKILIVVGTRPNFIKITQFKKIASNNFSGRFDIQIVHTGQHYDNKMADVFFEQFELVPDHFLEIPQDTPNTQMAEVMLRLEDVIENVEPHLVMVVGDVNSTFAAALTANKKGIKIAHLESGLRSFDRSMPEEINRILTDEITDYFFVTEQSGIDNLRKEGKGDESIYFVGNTMIDTMVAFDEKIENSSVLEKYGLSKGNFALMTMHRPATVDYESELVKLIKLISEITTLYPLVFPIHPRTVTKLKEFNLLNEVQNIEELILTEPMDYFSFQKLIACCRFVLTDSGGIQEEATYRKVPCLTLRPNTERPSTIDLGSNTLMAFELDQLNDKIEEIEKGEYKKGTVPPKWDGNSTKRIMKILEDNLN